MHTAKDTFSVQQPEPELAGHISLSTTPSGTPTVDSEFFYDAVTEQRVTTSVQDDYEILQPEWPRGV